VRKALVILHLYSEHKGKIAVPFCCGKEKGVNLYTWLNLAIIAFPVILSFDRRVAYWRSWFRSFAAILIVGGLFVAWDILVTEQGHWSFDPTLAGTTRFLGLPLGEIIFFISVPFACLFIFEVAQAYFKERCYPIPAWPFLVAAVGAILAAWILKERGYTLIVLVSFALTLLLIAGPARRLFSKRTTLLALLLSFVPFLIFNGIFTGIPIVRYDPAMILGPRVITIPLEDFVYNFSLIALSMMAYEVLSFLRIGERR
jgi:lycopene cyclase domain-containing protein